LWEPAALGDRAKVDEFLGADIAIIPGYSEQTALQAAAEAGTRRQILVDWLEQQGAADHP
jgi:hypothetical protein